MQCRAQNEERLLHAKMTLMAFSNKTCSIKVVGDKKKEGYPEMILISTLESLIEVK